MSYYATQKPFSGPDQCSDSEHWDAENNVCAPGLCPAGSHIGPTGDCIEGEGADESQSSSSDSTPASTSSSGGGGSGGGGGASPPPDGGDSGGGIGMGTIFLGLTVVAGIGYWFFKKESR